MAGSHVRLFASLLERLRQRDLPSDDAIQAIVDAVARAMGTEVATLYVFDACSDELVLAATQGLARAGVGFVTLKMGEGISGRAARTGQPVSCPDVRGEPSFKLIPGFDQSRYRSILAVPVMDEGKLVGALNVQSVTVRDYDRWATMELEAIAALIAPMLSRYWNRGDLALRLRGPQLLSSVDGFVAATLGPASICEELASGLTRILPDIRCSVALRMPDAASELMGVDPGPLVEESLAQSMAEGDVVEQSSEDTAVLALPLQGESMVCGSLAVWTAAAISPPWKQAHVLHYLQTLSVQVGLALERMLAVRPDTHNEAPSEESTLYSDLVELVLQDRGLDKLVEEASRACDTEIGIVDVFGTLLVGHIPERTMTDLPLKASDQLLGRMLASVSLRERPALETIAQVASLELAKWKARFEVETQLRGDVLDALLAGSMVEGRELQARTSLVGLDLRRCYTPVMFAFDTNANLASPLAIRSLVKAVHHHFGEPPAAVVFQRAEGLLALVSDCQDSPTAQVTKVVRDFRALAGLQCVGTGIGTPTQKPAEYAASVKRAMLSAMLGLRLGMSGPVNRHRLGVHGLLLAIDDTERLREFVDEQLGVLLTWDDKTGGNLIRTLEAYHISSEHLRPAARSLFVHVNTLKYRLARIEALTGRKLDDPVERFNMYLALYVLRLIEPNHSTLQPDESFEPDLAEMDNVLPAADR